MFLGFEDMDRLIERVARGAGDGYPPYNIERIKASDDQPERLRITLAVAGFSASDLDVTHEERQLVIKGRIRDQGEREFLHRGIANRQFQRAFLIADGIEIATATLRNGLLEIDLVRPELNRVAKRIAIRSSNPAADQGDQNA